MNIDINELRELLQQAEGTCYYYLHNSEDAEDIGQAVMLELYTKYKDIKNRESWIRTVSRNKCFEFMRNKSRYREMLGRYKVEDEILSEIQIEQFREPDAVSYEKLIAEIPDDYLKKRDRDLFMHYVNSGCEMSKWLESTGLNYESGKKKLYYIRRDIVAWINQSRKLFRGKSRLIGAHLNENIIHFINLFQTASQDNDWEKIRRYLAPGIEPPLEFKLPYYKDREYDVYRIKRDEFKIVITYWGPEKQASGFYLKVKIIRPHSIQITMFPRPVEKIVKLNINDLSPEVLAAMTQNPDGSYPCNLKEFTALLDKHGVGRKMVFSGGKYKTDPDKK